MKQCSICLTTESKRWVGTLCRSCYEKRYRQIRDGEHSKELERKRRYNSKNVITRKTHYKENPDVYFDRRLRTMYGVDIEWYNKQMEIQNNVCYICKKPPTLRKGVQRLSVDHNHTTGKVRGLLCNLCNPQLPIVEDKERLKMALEYLAKYG